MSSLFREGNCLAALGRYDDATLRYEQSMVFNVARNGNQPSHTGSFCEQGIAFLAAARGRYGDAEKLFRAAQNQYRNNQCQEGYALPSNLNGFSLGLADAEIARGDFNAAEKALNTVELRQEVEQYYEIDPGPSAKATRPRAGSNEGGRSS